MTTMHSGKLGKPGNFNKPALMAQATMLNCVSGNQQFSSRPVWCTISEITDEDGWRMQVPTHRRSSKPELLRARNMEVQRGCQMIIHPTSTRRLVWDLLGLAFIVYDFITIPLYLTMPIKTNLFITFMFWSTIFYWTFDIAMSFGTGFYDQNQIEMRPSRIAIHYMVTWFSFGVVLVAADWALIILFSDEDTDGGEGARLARVSKTVRAIRVLRSLRLLRLVKLKKMKETLRIVSIQSTFESCSTFSSCSSC
jgi:hypothetical protein